MAKWCIVLHLTMHAFSDFYFSHGGGLVAITVFVFLCVNLHGADDVSVCIFFVCGAVMVVVMTACVFSSRGNGSDQVYFIT